ncbi:hypothetical protein [Saccharothrix deserti]|uniref:hypothetical protein n=1 Tax=Saccharothrix deserti TaxID=2593674 RepID=UPI00131CC03C|nr:hypothetical protein [Saccharothrix deserti]
MVFDEGIGSAGVTRGEEGGEVIRIGAAALYGGDAEVANAIAHEPRHARHYLRHNRFESDEQHGSEESVADGTPFGAGNALQNWIEGRR